MSTGVATRISNSHEDLLCGQEPDGPYSCRVANLLFISDEPYTFQVAARNKEGFGSFSDPITKSIPILNITSQGIDPVIGYLLYLLLLS